jgi:hypothetical protein
MRERKRKKRVRRKEKEEREEGVKQRNGIGGEGCEGNRPVEESVWRRGEVDY